MKELNNASLPLDFAGGKYSTESVRLPNGQYVIKIVATGPCIGKVLKGNEVLTEVDFSSYKLLSYNDLKISFIISSESEISLEVTPKREDIKVYSASLYSSILPVGVGEYPTPTGTINITENGENIDVKQYAKANVAVPQPSGNIDITQNGEGIDIAQYATANVKIPTVTTIEPTMLTSKSHDEYTLPERKSLITLKEGEYVLDGDIITYTVDIDFDSAVLANENLAIIAKQGNNILPITVQRKFPAIFTLTASYDIVDGSYITLYYYVASDNYKLCTIGIN